MKIYFTAILCVLILASCGRSDMQEANNEPSSNKLVKIDSPNNENSINTIHKTEKAGLEVFMDTMNKRDYYQDTNRLKEVMAWSHASRTSKNVKDGRLCIELPFPVERLHNYFSKPQTYFFAKWNKEDSTFMNGTDYLLMTWEIDSAGISIEKEIYGALIDFMGNFPCYVFREQNRVYAIANRSTYNARRTKNLTEELKYYLKSESKVYGHHNRRGALGEAEY